MKRSVYCPACGRHIVLAESITKLGARCKNCNATLTISMTPVGEIEVLAVPRPTRENAGRLADARA